MEEAPVREDAGVISDSSSSSVEDDEEYLLFLGRRSDGTSVFGALMKWINNRLPPNNNGM